MSKKEESPIGDQFFSYVVFVVSWWCFIAVERNVEQEKPQRTKQCFFLCVLSGESLSLGDCFYSEFPCLSAVVRDILRA